jgi:hypothetical protein
MSLLYLSAGSCAWTLRSFSAAPRFLMLGMVCLIFPFCMTYISAPIIPKVLGLVMQVNEPVDQRYQPSSPDDISERNRQKVFQEKGTPGKAGEVE